MMCTYDAVTLASVIIGHNHFSEFSLHHTIKAGTVIMVSIPGLVVCCFVVLNAAHVQMSSRIQNAVFRVVSFCAMCSVT